MLSHEILSQCVDASTGSTERLTFVSSGKGEVRRSKFRFINCYIAGCSGELNIILLDVSWDLWWQIWDGVVRFWRKWQERGWQRVVGGRPSFQSASATNTTTTSLSRETMCLSSWILCLLWVNKQLESMSTIIISQQRYAKMLVY